MTNNIINIRTHNTIVESKDKITETLSKYTEKVINENKSVTYTEIPTVNVNIFLYKNWKIIMYNN